MNEFQTSEVQSKRIAIGTNCKRAACGGGPHGYLSVVMPRKYSEKVWKGPGGTQHWKVVNGV